MSYKIEIIENFSVITENILDTQKIIENFSVITGNVSDTQKMETVHSTEIPDWKYIHWLNVSLSSLGIIGAQLKAPSKPLNTIGQSLLYDGVRAFKGGLGAHDTERRYYSHKKFRNCI